MYIKNKRGQSTVEYVLLVTAVLAVIIALVATPKSGFRNQMNQTLNGAISEVGVLGDRYQVSHAGSNAAGPTDNRYIVKVD